MVTIIIMVKESLPGESKSALDFKDTATPIFSHSKVVFDLFVETHVLHIIAFLFNFSNFCWAL